MTTPNQLLLPLPKKNGWHHLPLVVSHNNQQTINLLQQPHQWQDGVLSLVGDQGAGKSFIAWYLFAAPTNAPTNAPSDSSSDSSTDSLSGQHSPLDHIGQMIEKKHLAWLGDKNLSPSQVVVWDNVDEDLPTLPAAAAEGLCYFFNQDRTVRPKLLMLSRRPLPWLLQHHRAAILPDLASRLSLVAGVQLLADDESLQAQVRGFFAERQVAVDEKTITSILRHAPRSHDELHRLLARLDDYSLRVKKPINQKMIQQWLDMD